MSAYQILIVGYGTTRLLMPAGPISSGSWQEMRSHSDCALSTRSHSSFHACVQVWIIQWWIRRRFMIFTSITMFSLRDLSPLSTYQRYVRYLRRHRWEKQMHRRLRRSGKFWRVGAHVQYAPRCHHHRHFQRIPLGYGEYAIRSCSKLPLDLVWFYSGLHPTLLCGLFPVLFQSYSRINPVLFRPWFADFFQTWSGLIPVSIRPYSADVLRTVKTLALWNDFSSAHDCRTDLRSVVSYWETPTTSARCTRVCWRIHPCSKRWTWVI